MSQWFLLAGAALVGIAAYLSAIGFRGRKYVLGIDLGTTFSVVAVKREGQVEVIPNHETGQLLTPSVVTYVRNASTDPEKKYMKFDKEFTHYLVGEPAMRRRETAPHDTIYHAKRFIGKSMFETTGEIGAHPFEVGNREFLNATELFKLADELQARPLVSERAFGKKARVFAECVAELMKSNAIVAKPAPGERSQGEGGGTATGAGPPSSSPTGPRIVADGAALQVCIEEKIKPFAAELAKVDEDRGYSRAREKLYNATRAEFRILAPAASASATGTENKHSDTTTTTASSYWGGMFPTRPAKWRTPIEVGSAVVKKLKDAAEEYLGYSVYECVICVPAKFGELEIKKTMEVFQQVGFRVARVMDEPSAAAVAYGLHKSATGKTVIVYDLGGGTLDVSVLKISTKAVNVLGTAGDDHLGGSDFDHAMLELLQTKCSDRQRDVELASPSAAETIKKQLSGSETVPFCGTTVSREEFETKAASLFKRTIEPVEKVMKDQMMTHKDINHVVLVGGATRMPRIRRMLIDFFGREKLNMDLDPDLTVAIGAANIDQ